MCEHWNQRILCDKIGKTQQLALFDDSSGNKNNDRIKKWSWVCQDKGVW